MTRKSWIHRIITVWVLVLSLIIPESCTVFAGDATDETEKEYAFFNFGKKETSDKLKIPYGSDITETIGGRVGRVLSITQTGKTTINFDVDDEFIKDLPTDVPIDIVVEYFDRQGGGSFTIEYDSHNPQSEYNGAVGGTNTIYRQAEPCYLEGTETWRAHTWTLNDMKMSNRINNVADFRLSIWGPIMYMSKTDVVVGSIKISYGEFETLTNIVVNSAQTGNVFSNEAEEICLNVNINNKTFESISGDYAVNIYDRKTLEEVHTAKFTANVGARETETIEVKFKNPGRNTIYTIDIEETVWYKEKPEEKKTRVSGSECSVAMLLEKGEGNPVYGHMSAVATMNRGYPDEVFDYMASVGSTWNREECNWKNVEVQKGVLALPEGVKEIWQKQKEAGIEFMYLCLGTNPNYDNGKTPASDEAIAAFAKYCAFMAKELKDITNYFEIWNEWNIVSFNPSNEPPETYVKLLKASYKAIKEVNPDAVVIGLSTATVDLNWTRRVFEAGGYEYMDAVSVHPYDFSAQFRDQKFVNEAQDLKKLMAEYGEIKPLYYSELGFSTVNGPTESQRDYIGYTQTSQAAAKILSNALIRAYDLCDVLLEYTFYDRNNQADIESCWGLAHRWDTDNVPYKPRSGAKESLLAICAMNSLWGANTDFKDIITKDRAYAMNFYNNKDERNVLVLATGDGEHSFNIDLGAKTVDLYDMYGNKTATLHSDNGVYAFGANMVPYYVIGKFTKFEESSLKGAVTPHSITQIGTANDIATFTFTKNIPVNMTLFVGEAPGVTVAENKGFKGNEARVVLQTGADALGERIIPVTIKDKTGKIYYYADHRLQLKDPISISIASQRISENDNNHWAVKVTVHNNSQAGKHSGEVQLLAPGDAALKSRIRSFSNLGPGKNVVYLFNLPVSIVKKPTDVEVKVKLDSGLEFRGSNQLVFTTAKYAKTAPVIDGFASSGEWQKNWFGVNEVKDVKMLDSNGNYTTTDNWKGPDDVSFNATMMWDEENLYMLAVVRDNIHSVKYSPPTIDRMWIGDSIQFGIDDRDIIAQWQEGEFSGFDVAEHQTGKNVIFRRYSLYDDLLPMTVVDSAEVVVKHRNGTTTYECKIPWSEIFYKDYKVNPDGVYRFSAMVNDNDGAGRRGWIEYTSGIGGARNAGMFGGLILEK